LNEIIQAQTAGSRNYKTTSSESVISDMVNVEEIQSNQNRKKRSELL
jgi:hypothetical protein